MTESGRRGPGFDGEDGGVAGVDWCFLERRLRADGGAGNSGNLPVRCLSPFCCGKKEGEGPCGCARVRGFE